MDKMEVSRKGRTSAWDMMMGRFPIKGSIWPEMWRLKGVYMVNKQRKIQYLLFYVLIQHSVWLNSQSSLFVLHANPPYYRDYN